MSDQNISRQLRSSGIPRTINMMKRHFLVQKNVRTGQLIREQMLIMLSTHESQSQV